MSKVEFREEFVAFESEERMRSWLKLALEQAKKLLSTRTGLIHGAEVSGIDDLRVVVPIVDNIAYVLLLLRARQTEQIQEAKTLLQRILAWQSEAGNFPVYLHEFPSVNDRYLSAALLPLFVRIASEYESVLGVELKLHFRRSCEALIANGRELLKEKETSLPLIIRVKLASALAAFGKLWNQSEWQHMGEEVLKRVFELDFLSLKLSPQLLGELFVGLSLYYPLLKEVPWPNFCATTYATWDVRRECYCGPALCLSQYGYELQVGIYALFWALSEGVAPMRLLPHMPNFYLQAAQLYPWLESSENSPKRLEGECETKWVSHQKEEYSLSYCTGVTPEDPAKNYSYHPLRVVFGNGSLANSLVCQAPPGVAFNWKEEGDFLIGEACFLKEFDEGDKQSTRELIFAWNHREGIKTAVLQQPASLFFLEQPIQVRFPEGTVDFSFELKGKGAFTGHLIPGNRLSQVGLKGELKYQQYDGLLFLRTLHREVGTTVRFKITLNLGR